MDEEECRELQTAELELLTAAYLNDVTIKKRLLPATTSFSSSYLTDVRARLAEGVYLDIVMPSSFPTSPLTASISCINSVFVNKQFQLMDFQLIDAQISSYIQREFENNSLNCMELISLAKSTIDGLRNITTCTTASSSKNGIGRTHDIDSHKAIIVMNSDAMKLNADQPSASSQPPPHALKLKLVRVLIYFHHIKSPYKKKEIVSQAIDLDLGGVWKEGFPGVVIVEGIGENVYEYVRRLQQLRWQHMVVRGEEIEEGELVLHQLHDGLPNDVAAIQTSVINRKFACKSMVEVASMSDLGQYCKSHHVHDLFMSITRKNV